MSCQGRSFETFLVISILSSLFLTIAALNLQVDKDSYLSQQGLNYIYAMLGWMFVTILFYLLAYIRTFLLFPLPVILSVIGLFGQILGIAMIDVSSGHSTLLVLGLVSGYFVPLQIFGAVLSIVYFRRSDADFPAPLPGDPLELLL